jgi:prolyl-tRNA synthetase|tara:strand:+ start:277 stop:1722 length:1446 start_codon:yes stop_codon:yes gene_type:complete
MSKEIGITVKKDQDFSDWYSQVVLKSELIDYASAKGFIILRPYGYAIWDKIKEYVDQKIKETGHQNAYFPALIPEGLLKKEGEHFEGFIPEVFWVTQAGNRKIGERLALRPTSETIAYDSYSKWIRSWRDLPLLLNFWNTVMRAEIKSTKPFIRNSEFLWQEGHTAHITEEEAKKEVRDILEMYKKLIEEELAIPVLTGTKTEKEKFVGAVFTTTLEAMMPDGLALQMGTSHNLGQNFSRPFEISFLGNDKQEHYVWQTSWGVSWRLIGAIIMIHGDDKGLVLPPRISSIQVVIIPIHYKDQDIIPVREKVEKLANKLKQNKIKVYVDVREHYTPGWKFHEWEMKGIPLRIEIGPRDISKEEVTLVRRDKKEKISIREDNVVEKVSVLLEEIQNNLFEKAKRLQNDLMTRVENFEEFKKTIKKKGGFVRACWCLESKCENAVKEETGADIRVMPFVDEEVFGSCVHCGKQGKKVVYFARSY